MKTAEEIIKNRIVLQECKWKLDDKEELMVKRTVLECMELYADQFKKLQVSEIDWETMRNVYFKECTRWTHDNNGNREKLIVDTAPHDLFEWFKRAVTGKP